MSDTTNSMGNGLDGDNSPLSSSIDPTINTAHTNTIQSLTSNDNTFDSDMSVAVDDDTNELTELCSSVLNDIFHEFDIDKDDLWSIDEIQSFAQQCNDRKLSDEEINELLDNYESDDSGKKLRCDGFIDMMYMQIVADWDEFCKDLLKLGYNSKLQKI